jgi:hypothetical protein
VGKLGSQHLMGISESFTRGLALRHAAYGSHDTPPHAPIFSALHERLWKCSQLGPHAASVSRLVAASARPPDYSATRCCYLRPLTTPSDIAFTNMMTRTSLLSIGVARGLFHYRLGASFPSTFHTAILGANFIINASVKRGPGFYFKGTHNTEQSSFILSHIVP